MRWQWLLWNGSHPKTSWNTPKWNDGVVRDIGSKHWLQRCEKKRRRLFWNSLMKEAWRQSSRMTRPKIREEDLWPAFVDLLSQDHSTVVKDIKSEVSSCWHFKMSGLNNFLELPCWIEKWLMQTFCCSSLSLPVLMNIRPPPLLLSFDAALVTIPSSVKVQAKGPAWICTWWKRLSSRKDPAQRCNCGCTTTVG